MEHKIEEFIKRGINAQKEVNKILADNRMEHEKELNDYMERFRRDVLPQLEKSAFVMAIAPDDKNADLKIAIEIGCAILLDKPLVVFKPKDREVSPRLLEVADRVIEGDIETDRERMLQEITDFIKREIK